MLTIPTYRTVHRKKIKAEKAGQPPNLTELEQLILLFTPRDSPIRRYSFRRALKGVIEEARLFPRTAEKAEIFTKRFGKGISKFDILVSDIIVGEWKQQRQ